MQVPNDLDPQEAVGFVASREMEAALEVMKGCPPDQFKDALWEYVEESIHAGWDGYRAAELVAIGAFLTDLAVFVKALDK